DGGLDEEPAASCRRRVDRDVRFRRLVHEHRLQPGRPVLGSREDDQAHPTLQAQPREALRHDTRAEESDRTRSCAHSTRSVAERVPYSSSMVSEPSSNSDAGLFGPASVSWRVNRETSVLFGGARALLMHAAHPLVLAGARQTGFYERNPWKRLERTLRLTYTMTFGTRREAEDAAARINQV